MPQITATVMAVTAGVSLGAIKTRHTVLRAAGVPVTKISGSIGNVHADDALTTPAGLAGLPTQLISEVEPGLRPSLRSKFNVVDKTFGPALSASWRFNPINFALLSRADQDGAADSVRCDALLSARASIRR